MANEVETNGKVEVSEETKSEEDKRELEQRIIRQIEYYFGDINLSKDKFLQSQIKEDDGWVTLDVMLKFKRLARLTEDKTTIANAVAKSQTKLMEISKDKTKIRRSPDKPVPEMNEEKKKEIMTRTVYCKGFPKDSDLDTVLDFFSKQWAIENLVMRNYQNRETKTWHFKGSVFVVFPTVEAAEGFLKLESVKYKEVELIRLWQTDYAQQKQIEWQEGRKKKLEKKKEQEKKAEEKEEEEEEEEEEGFPTGTIVHMKGIGEGVTREMIKEKIEGHGIAVAFIDFFKGGEEGWVRLEEKDTAKELLEKLTDNKMNINGADVDVRVLEGEEETAYMNKAKNEMAKRRHATRQSRRKGQGGRGGGGRGGGRGGFRKRRGGPSKGAPPAKLKAH